MLLFVFGCVAVVYAVYWAGRAVSATKEAAVIFKQSGSLAETVRRLYAHETTPDAYRMSSRQRAYVQTNFDDFVSIYNEDMHRMVGEMLAQLRAKKAAAGEPMSEGELGEAESSARILVASHFAKGGANFEASLKAAREGLAIKSPLLELRLSNQSGSGVLWMLEV